MGRRADRGGRRADHRRRSGTVPLGPYQLQAAIAAVHDEAPTADDTDWPQILALYELLDRVAPNPMVTLNRAVAVAMVHGPAAGLDLLATLDDDRARRRPPPAASRCAPTCSRWPATSTPHAPRTARRPGARPAARSSATSTPRAARLS